MHIHTVLPNVTMAILNGWMHSFHHVNGIKMDEIIKRYLDEGLMFVKKAEQDDKTFLRAQVKPSMSRTSAYYVDIVLYKNGSVCESQCECTSGVGPDTVCKNRIILLYGIIRHCAGEEIITQKSNTSMLQSHHIPVKLHKGSPKKAGHLSTRLKDFQSKYSK